MFLNLRNFRELYKMLRMSISFSFSDFQIVLNQTWLNEQLDTQSSAGPIKSYLIPSRLFPDKNCRFFIPCGSLHVVSNSRNQKKRKHLFVQNTFLYVLILTPIFRITVIIKSLILSFHKNILLLSSPAYPPLELSTSV